MKYAFLISRRWLPSGFALLLGAGGGYLVGRPAGGAAGRPGEEATGRPGADTGSEAGRMAAAAGAPKALQDAARGLVLPRGADTTQTLRNILALPDSLERLAVLQQWCRQLPPAEMLGVMGEFKAMMEAQEQVGDLSVLALLFQSVDGMAQALLEQGPGQALAAMWAARPPEGDQEMGDGLMAQVFNKWAAQDLPGAQAFLERRLAPPAQPGELDKEFSRNLMRNWVKSDPEAAMAWLQRQPAAIGDAALKPAFQALSHADSAKAMQLVKDQAELPGRDRIAADIASWWARSHPQEALGWAQGLPEKLAGAAVRDTLTTWMKQDFGAAQEAVGRLSAALQLEALPVLMREWKAGDAAKAAAFLEQQAVGPGRPEAVEALVRNWAGDDQQAASAWLAKQAQGPERDAGALALADQIRRTDPEAAALWGASLGDAQLRQKSLQDTLQVWYRKSAAEAVRWVEEDPHLTEVDRAVLLGSGAPSSAGAGQ